MIECRCKSPAAPVWKKKPHLIHYGYIAIKNHCPKTKYRGANLCVRPFKLMNKKVGTKKLDHQVLLFTTNLNHNIFVAIVNIQYLNIENTS
jgi:hypothetical protein